MGIDPASGRILTIAFRGSGMGRAPGDMLSVYSDFREVDGLTLPFASETTYNGEPMIKGVNHAVVINPPVDDAAFEMPE